MPYVERVTKAGNTIEISLEVDTMAISAFERVVQEQQETIEKQSRLIADLIATLESWEQTAGYDGAELKERAENLQLRERQDL